MKKKVNIKVIIVIILIILVLILLIINAILYAYNKNNNKTSESNNTVENANQTLENGLTEDDFKNTFYNNYLLTYILEGDIQIGSGTLKTSEDGEVYYAVTDYLLEDIHSLEDINKLINDNIDSFGVARIRKIMESSYSNKYIAANNRLYVKKRLEEKVDISHIQYELRGEDNIVIYERVPYTFVFEENKKPKATRLWFTCIKDFGGIGIGKDDVFEPTEEDLFTPEDFEHDE